MNGEDMKREPWERELGKREQSFLPGTVEY